MSCNGLQNKNQTKQATALSYKEGRPVLDFTFRKTLSILIKHSFTIKTIQAGKQEKDLQQKTYHMYIVL